jgi:hypothetical protein
MKKITLLILMFTVFGGCEIEKDYKKQLEMTLDNMSEVTILSAVYIDAITDVWKTAIYDNKYNGKYCSDFNKALADYIPKLRSTKGYIELKSKADSINFEVKELSDYPPKYKDAYIEVAELTPMVKDFFQLASSPTGSLTSYSSHTEELFGRINNKISTMKLKYVDVK